MELFHTTRFLTSLCGYRKNNKLIQILQDALKTFLNLWKVGKEAG